MTNPTFTPAREATIVQVAPGVHLPIPSLLTIPDHPEQGFDTKIEIEFDGVKVFPQTVAVRSRTNRPVTGTELRAVRVAGLVAEHLSDYAVDSLGVQLITRDAGEVAELREAGIRDGRTLEFVANGYQMARALGLPPAKFVQERLGLTRPTATRWIRQVREMGWIDGLMTDAPQQGSSDGND